MISGLDPYHLTPTASLNRLRIVELPGVEMEPDVAGKLAFDLLGAEALAELVRAQAYVLGLDPAGLSDTRQVPHRLAGCFLAEEPATRGAAEHIARRFGRRIAYLILAVKRGDPVNRAARADWDDSYWAHWARVRQVWLGGGLMSGEFGRRAAAEAAACVRAGAQTDCTIRRAEHPAVLPLIGAARSGPAGAAAALVLDFGQSAVKRARARYAEHRLAALELLPPVPSPITALFHDLSPEEVAGLADNMAAGIVAGWREAAAGGAPLAPVVVASIAAYMHDGQPLPRQGGPYSTLHALAPRFADWLSAEVSRRLGQTVAVALLHDGTAAASAYAGQPRSAVITLGTALGVGFPPPAETLRPLATGFSVVSR